MHGFIPEKPYHDRLGTFFIAWWCFYFTVALVLHVFDYIIFNIPVNVFLAIIVSTPFPHTLQRYRLINNSRHLGAVFFSFALLWYQSRLPPLTTLIHFFTDKNVGASPAFLFGLFIRSINIPALIGALLFFGVCVVFAQTRFKKWYPIVVSVIIFSLWVAQFTTLTSARIETIATDRTDMKKLMETIGFSSESEKELHYNLITLKNPEIPDDISPEDFLPLFYKNEKDKRTEFPRQIARPPDVIILQICSFGWEDFTVAGVNMNPFFSQFDYIFTNFNSADSYSHTSAIRLLRGMCGQTPHKNLFQNAPKECYVMDRFRSLGYQTFSVFNHDGVYADFTKLLTSQAKIDQPMSIDSFNSFKIGFDNSKIYNDYDVLSSWFSQNSSSTFPLATYYNSISLHAGTHHLHEKNWWKRSSESLFKESVDTVGQDITRFFNDLAASGRPAIVVVVAEHGAALKKNPIQIQTVRQIPLPDITHVPAAIKIFGPGFNKQASGTKKIISTPTSYRGLYTLVGRIMQQDFINPSPEQLARITLDLPQSDMVATSDTATVIKRQNTFYYKNSDRAWEKLPTYSSLPSVNFRF